MSAPQPSALPTPLLTKRCPTCGRFRAYEPGDAYCMLCGSAPLESECACGRDFAYALDETGDLHCPRCGRMLRGRAPEFGS